jgi:Domain of unknown function (DUF5642)
MLGTTKYRFAVLLLSTITAAAIFPGCASDVGGRPGSGGPSAPGKAQSVPAEPPGGYDISRIANVANDFPPGFTVAPGRHTVVTQQMVDSLAGLAGGLKPAVDPPQCTPATQGNVVVGTQMQSVSADGPQHVAVMATQTAQVNPASSVPTGCEHVSLTMNDGSASHGTEDTVTSPTITGIPTYGFKIHWESAPITGEPKDIYKYDAVLSDKTVVGVQGESDPQLLQDLLIKAVSAIRGQ